MNKNKKKLPKMYIDSDMIESEGSMTTTENSGDRKKEALKRLKDKVNTQLVKTASERAVAAEKDGDDEELQKILKKIKELKK